MQLQGKKSKECEKELDYNIMNEFNKEIFEYNAKFLKLKSLVPLYFCGKTNSEFSKVEASTGWWDITQEQSGHILSVMHEEYECNL